MPSVENKQPEAMISKWSQTNDMGSNKTMENFYVTYLTVCQDPKPVCTVKFGNEGMHRKSVT